MQGKKGKDKMNDRNDKVGPSTTFCEPDHALMKLADSLESYSVTVPCDPKDINA